MWACTGLWNFCRDDGLKPGFSLFSVGRVWNTYDGFCCGCNSLIAVYPFYYISSITHYNVKEVEFLTDAIQILIPVYFIMYFIYDLLNYCYRSGMQREEPTCPYRYAFPLSQTFQITAILIFLQLKLKNPNYFKSNK